jgi:Chs5-Arf1p-binding protein BUD7/BCH1
MEEEYRMQKAQTEINHAIATTNGHTEHESGDMGRMVIHEDGTVVPSSKDSDPRASDDNASTRAMVSPTMKASSTHDINGSSLDVSSAIPIIRVSTESDRDLEEKGTEDTLPPHKEAQPNGVSDTLEKPVQAAAGEGEQSNGESNPLPAHEPFSFSNKRLCERWLDNLFMVLYEVSYSRFHRNIGPDIWLGSTSVDDIPSRSRSLQDAARCLP